MRGFRAAWLAATLGAAGAVACVEQATAPGSCPTFCPSGSITVVDTVLRTSITRDSAFRGYVLAHQAGAMVATEAPGVDSRAMLLTSTLISPDTTTFLLLTSDSVKLTLIIIRRDTSAHNLMLNLYQLPDTIDSTTTFADVAGAFSGAPLRTVDIDALLAKPGGIDSTTGDSIATDTTTHRLILKVKFDSLQLPYVAADSGKLGFGIRVGATTPASVSFSTREDPTSGGSTVTWFMKVDSIKGSDTTLVRERYPRGTRFDTYVFDPPVAPLDSTLAVGGAPSARSILHVTLPRGIRDSSQIIRGTLLLVPAVPARGAPVDSFVLEAHTVLADFGAKSPLVLDATRTDTTMIRVGATDTVRIEVTNLLQFWSADTTRPAVILLRSQEEGAHPSEVRFYPSKAAAYRPSLRVTYAPRFPFGVP